MDCFGWLCGCVVGHLEQALFIPVLTVTLQILADDSGAVLSPEDASKVVFSKMFDHTVALVLGGFSIASAFSKFAFQMHFAALIQRKLADRPYASRALPCLSIGGCIHCPSSPSLFFTATCSSWPSWASALSSPCS